MLSTASHSAGCTQNARRDSSSFTAVAPPSTLCNSTYIYIYLLLLLSRHMCRYYFAFQWTCYLRFCTVFRFSRQLTDVEVTCRPAGGESSRCNWRRSEFESVHQGIAPYKSYLLLVVVLLLIIINNRRLTQSVNRPNASSATARSTETLSDAGSTESFGRKSISVLALTWA